MKRKETVYKGLEFIDVYFTDSSATSPDYFQISEFPLRLTAGKNLFKLRGNPTNLKVGGVLNLEVLDYNGNPIYTEVVDFLDEDKSRVIAIYIYEDTSPGDCTVTLIAEAAIINGQPAPIEWQGRANVKWTRTIPVNPNVSNDSEIIFETLPAVTVSEQIGVQLDRTYSGSVQFPTYTTGQVRYFEYNNQPAIEISGGTFTGDMSTGTITVATPQNPTPTPNYTVSTTPYVSTIKKILSPSLALLDDVYTVYSSQSVFPHTYTQFDNSAFSLEYEASPTYVATENSQSFALIQITGLEPATGDVSRIKVFTNNNGTVGTWDLVNDVELDETEIFISNTASLFPDQSIGIFTSQSIIDTYWTAHTYQNGIEVTPTTLQWTTASMSNAMLISSSINIANSSSIQVAQISGSFAGIFKQDASYKVTLDAIGTRVATSNNLQPKLSIYVSGSSFYQDPTDYFNQQFPTKFGKRIGEITTVGDAQRFDDQTFSFTADYTGTGVLLLVVETGEWQVSDIHVVTDNDAGYTPDYTRLKTPIQTTHKIDNQISFKVEYYNVAGVKSKQISYVYNKDWEGGNRYIDGNFSMLTGSLYVADSLNSGVAISGYPNAGWVRSLGYEGFAAGYPGFLLWSGSALPGSAGTKGGAAYSGVGLELYANTASYFRYSTTDSEIDVRTNKFFFGNPATTFISGANGNIEISASGFHLTAQGNVTASSFIAVQGGEVLFDSNSEFVDGLNVGRVVYFNRSEFTYTGSLSTTGAQTASIFETFILPGETRMQMSLMYNFNAATSTTGNLEAQWYIQSASISGSTGTSTGYDSWSTPQSLFPSTQLITTIDSTGTYEGGSRTFTTTSATFANYQGRYVRIYMIVSRGSTGNAGDLLAMKGFVYRTSRAVGSSILPPPGGIIS
jgi:hypothetical protein